MSTEHLTEHARAVRENILRVAENIPADKLHMRVVAHKAECGTARCLLGWMLVDRWFQKNCAPITYLDPKERREGEIPFLITVANLAMEAQTAPDTLHKLFGYGLGWEERADGTYYEHGVSKKDVVKNAKRLAKGNDAALVDYRPKRRR